MMKSRKEKDKSGTSFYEVTPLDMGNLNPNSRITGELFNARNYTEWSYSVKLALGGLRRLGFVDGTVSEVSEDDPKYAEWKEENVLIMSWICNSMGKNISRSFQHCKTAKELWDSIRNAYSQKRNHARIYQLTRELANLKQGDASLRDYYNQIQEVWRELELCHPIPAGQERDVENRRIYELLGGVNSEYETVRAQVLSQDPLPSVSDVFTLLQSEEDRRRVMLVKDQTSSSQERSALVVNEWGGRGRGRGGWFGHGRGQNNVDRDKLQCTYCGKSRHTREYCWDLNGKPGNTFETEKINNEEGMTTCEAPTFELKRKWIKEQELLKQRLVLKDHFTWTISSQKESSSSGSRGGEKLRYIGGVDLSFSKDDPSIACGALVVLDLESLTVVYEDFRLVQLHIPYVAGFLAFREAPVLLELLEKMKQDSSRFYPQLLMVDGNGVLHPRGFGLACHLGVMANLPSVGIGKKLHCVDGLTESGVTQLLEAQENRTKDVIHLIGKSGRTWGVAMRTTEGSLNPIFISTGHRISLDTAIAVVKKCHKYRVPEPIRQADTRSREYLRKQLPKQKKQPEIWKPLGAMRI